MIKIGNGVAYNLPSTPTGSFRGCRGLLETSKQIYLLRRVFYRLNVNDKLDELGFLQSAKKFSRRALSGPTACKRLLSLQTRSKSQNGP